MTNLDTTPSVNSAEQRLKALGIELPMPPEPFGTYAEAVQTGNLLFLTGMLPTEGRRATFTGRIGAEIDVEGGRKAARLAALNALAVARQHLGSLDKVTRIVRLGVSVATTGDAKDQPKVADGASELLQQVFGKEKNPSRLVYGVSSLPLGASVELELIFEVDGTRVRNLTSYRTIQIEGLSIFYREAGPKDAPTLLLLHGLPSSSRMFEPLFARLADRYPPGRARLPGLRAQRLAGPEEICLHVRPLRRDHESLRRSARALALHAVHAGLRRPRGVSHGPSPSGADRGAHRTGRSGAQRRPGGELEAAACLLGRSRRQRKHAAHESPVAGDDAHAPCRKRS